MALDVQPALLTLHANTDALAVSAHTEAPALAADADSKPTALRGAMSSETKLESGSSAACRDDDVLTALQPDLALFAPEASAHLARRAAVQTTQFAVEEQAAGSAELHEQVPQGLPTSPRITAQRHPLEALSESLELRPAPHAHAQEALHAELTSLGTARRARGFSSNSGSHTSSGLSSGSQGNAANAGVHSPRAAHRNTQSSAAQQHAALAAGRPQPATQRQPLTTAWSDKIKHAADAVAEHYQATAVAVKQQADSSWYRSLSAKSTYLAEQSLKLGRSLEATLDAVTEPMAQPSLSNADLDRMTVDGQLPVQHAEGGPLSVRHAVADVLRVPRTTADELSTAASRSLASVRSWSRWS